MNVTWLRVSLIFALVMAIFLSMAMMVYFDINNYEMQPFMVLVGMFAAKFSTVIDHFFPNNQLKSPEDK